MPPTTDEHPHHDKEQTIIPDTSFRVLLTGFGPFRTITENPSWLAVKPLHNTLLITTPSGSSGPSLLSNPTAIVDGGDSDVSLSRRFTSRPIHITAIEMPVTYDAVLSTVPGFHTRPPTFPQLPVIDGDHDHDHSTPSRKTQTVLLPPPASGYDLVMHVGVAGPGQLLMETLGHKSGYDEPDAEGRFAPVVPEGTRDTGGAVVDVKGSSDGESGGGDGGGDGPPVRRGFQARYERFPEELVTEVDVQRMVRDLNQSGTQINLSTDAGHYLCDFIYYCSLAESRRRNFKLSPLKKKEEEENKPATTPVLFLHCCPVGEPLSTEEVTEGIRKIVIWVCNDLLRKNAGSGGCG